MVLKFQHTYCNIQILTKSTIQMIHDTKKNIYLLYHMLCNHRNGFCLNCNSHVAR